MKKLGLILPLAVLFSVLFFSQANAQSSPQPVYYYISSNVPGDYIFTFTGLNGQGTYTYDVSVSPGDGGFLDNLPEGEYDIDVEVLDSNPGIQMIFYSGNPNGEGVGYIGYENDENHFTAYVGPDNGDQANELDIDLWD